MKGQVAHITRSQYAIHILDWVFVYPIFNSSNFATRVEIPSRTVRRLLTGLRQEVVPLPLPAERHERLAVVGVVRPSPNGRPLGQQRRDVRLHPLPPAARRIDPARMKAARRPQAADEHAMHNRACSAPQLRPVPSNNFPPTSVSVPSTNTRTKPLAADSCSMTAGAAHRAKRLAASHRRTCGVFFGQPAFAGKSRMVGLPVHLDDLLSGD